MATRLNKIIGVDLDGRHNNKIKSLYQAILEVNNNRALNISNVDCTSKVILEITGDK